MNDLILVKHSLPEIVKKLPAREWILSAEGKRRARILAEKLRPYQPDMIISSREPKAVQTAEIVANILQLGMQIADDLHEHERSNVAFLSQEAFEMNVREFFNKPSELIFGIETASQALERFHRAVRLARSHNEDRTIVIVTHGTVISLFISHCTGLPGFSLWKDLGLPSYIVFDMHSNAIVKKENVS